MEKGYSSNCGNLELVYDIYMYYVRCVHTTDSN
jgi:hypothetical protein